MSAIDSVTISEMSGKEPEVIPANTEVAIDGQKVYSTGTVTFALKQYLQNGKTQLVYNQPEKGMMTVDGLQMRISDGSSSKELIVYGSTGVVGEPFSTTIGDVKVSVYLRFKINSTSFFNCFKRFSAGKISGFK